MNYLHPNELIVYKKNNNELHSAGFGINSILLNRGLSPFSSHVKRRERDEELSSSDEDDDAQDYHKNLAVPFGLYVKPYESHKDEHCEQVCKGTVPDVIHETFIALVGVPEQVVKQTKNHKNRKPSSTKKRINRKIVLNK